MNSGALEHWSETDWSRFCCSVVGHDPLETVETFVRDGVEIRNVKYLVDVPGYGTLEPPNPKPVGWLRPAKRRLRPHQWNGVCYMGKQENEVWGGGFLADEMGFGKVRPFLVPSSRWT